MNTNVVFAVAKRDLKSWFGNPTGYVFIMLFVAVSAGVMMWSAAFFTNNLANLETWSNWFPEIAAVFVAAATMGMWTNERANGTQELLFTLPARDIDLLAGKFLAYVAVYTISLLFTLALPLALMLLGNPDFGQLFANYVGYWLLGVMLVSVSMLGSQLTQNQTIAFILSIIACAAIIYLGNVLGWLGFHSWKVNGTIGQFNEFARGMLPGSGIVLFLGLTFTFLYLNLALIHRRHWRGRVEGAHGVMQSVGLGVATLALTVIGVYMFPRIDATVEGIHSLGDESRQLLAKLDPDKPVFVTAYVSEEVPENFVQQRRLLLNLLDQFDSIGGSAVQKSIIIPEPFSEEARRAEDNYGIRPMPVADEQPGGGYREMQVFLGLVVASGTEEVVTPFIEPGLPLEYEITRSIRVVSKADRKKIGILKTDVDMVGGFDFQTFAQKPKWQIATELEQQYRVANVDPDNEFADDIDCLVVPQPSSLTQEQMDKLQGWILAGHPTLLFEDPLPLSAPGTAADDQKGSMQQRMMGGGGPQKGDIDALFRAIGVQVHKTDIVWDTSQSGYFGGGLPQHFLFCKGPGLSADNIITSGLQTAVWLAGGHFTDGKKAGFVVKSLVSSPDPAATGGQNGIIPKYESRSGARDGLLVWSPFGGGLQPNPGARPRALNERIDLVVRVTGEAPKPNGAGGDAEPAAGGKVDVIAWADLDAIGDQFFGLRRQQSDANLRFDNVTLVLNCIDSLVGDESLIELRKRRPILRRLDAVEKAQAEYEKKWTEEKSKAETEAQNELDAAQQRLDDAVAAIRNDPSLDAQSKELKIVEVQQTENRKFEAAKAKIEDQKRVSISRAQHDRNQARKGIHDGYRLWTILLAPVPALLLGIATFFRRGSRAASIVPKNRQAGSSGGAQ
ncbi:MAG: Gldg family protein [Planctomycetes bacterium]|nr:Gldg family protein [Planctomycetota bacterium]